MAVKYCNAKSKRTGEACRARAVTGSEKCYHHGGRTPKGIASPHFKHGKFSTDLPTRLAERYQGTESNPDLLALREEIRLSDVRLGDLLSRVDSKEAGFWWNRLDELWKEYRKALMAQDVDATRIALEQLGHAITQGKNDYAAWAEVFHVIDARRKLVESERKYALDMQQMISAARAMALMGALVNIVRTHVNDPAILSAISADAGKLIGGPVSEQSS